MKSRVQVKINHCLQVSTSLMKDENGRARQVPYRKNHQEITSFLPSCCDAQFHVVRLFVDPVDTANGIESDLYNSDIWEALSFLGWCFLVKRVAFWRSIFGQ